MDLDDEIAIVGVGCRFPGADNLDEFWRVLVNGENHVLEIPKDRWNNEAFYSENKDDIGKHYVKRAGFLKNYDEWDHRLFGVSESEAVRIDPQQRYVLECTHMAMEDGGITRADLKNSQTGVYIGVMNDDYKVLANSDHNDDTNYSATGMSTTIIASRVSYTYDLRGPCMVIDTACSSSMIAIHLGSQAIRSGDCDMAVCGGVSSIISPDTFIALCRARMLSAVGQCQTFCDTADGYARGEGCGVVILKKVRQAMEDGNKIWAILRTGSNQDGHATSPITAPSGDQQEMLLHKVYTQYGVDPTNLQYIETHGTGTPIGDPTETNALGRFVSSHRSQEKTELEKVPEEKTKEQSEKLEDRKEELDDNANHEKDIEDQSDDSDSVKEGDNIKSGIEDTEKDNSQEKRQENEKYPTIKIGSVKTNIGHTESAAGVAGLIKVLLMMKNGKLVPSLHLKKDKSNLNKKIKLDEYNLDVVLDVEDWEPNKDGERICCVNSFGFGGSNSHAIVLQKKFPHTPKIREINNVPLVPYNVFCLSAVDKVALQNTMKRFEKEMRTNDISLTDIAYTCAFRRDHHAVRTLIYGQHIEELLEQLKFKAKTIEKIQSATQTRLIFVFCGVGTTWTGMCAEMMRLQPVFSAKIEEIDSYLEPLSGWRIADKFKDDATDYSDPFMNHIAIFCTQVALFAVWGHFGIRPEVIVGQSVGEVAASVASGSLSLEDGVKVIYHRSKILADKTGGKMMVAGNLPVEKLQDLCDKYDNRVTIAVYNSPTSCTLSGDTDVMEQIKDDLEAINTDEDAGILIRPLSVQCAYHSHHVESCMEDIEYILSDISRGTRTIDHISTVTGESAGTDEFQTGAYWAENIRQPVQFMQALLKASKEKMTNVFVEVGPRQVLRAHLPNIMGENLTGACLPSMNAKKENVSIFSSLNDLYEMGASLNWSNLAPSDGTIEAVPRYVFNKSKILYVPETASQFLKGIQRSANTHMYVRPNGGEQAEFRIEIDRDTTPFVYDHYFLNAILVPGATYVEAAFEVGQRKSRYGAHELSVSVEFVNPFTPPDEKQYLIEIEVTEDDEIDGHQYRAFKDGRTLCLGTICERVEPERSTIDIDAIRERCKTYRSKEESYRCLERIDFNYGESLSLMEQSWASTTECIAEFIIPNSVKEQTKNTHIHPSVIDAMFQTFGVLSTVGVIGGPTLPKGAGSVTINRPPQERMFCYSQMVKSTPIGNHYNCLLLSPEGYVIAEVQDFYTKTMRISDAPNQSIVYDMAWNEVQISEPTGDTELENNKHKPSGKLLVFGSNRFKNCFMPLKDQANAAFYEINHSLPDTEAMIRLAFDQIPNARATVFAACHHVQQSKQAERVVYDLSKTSFLSLALLIKVLRENNYNIPIFVVTENVIAYPTLNIGASNVCGGEMWGMVRSAMGETAYSDIRLVDMSLSEENANALEYLTRPDTQNQNEYLIDEGKIYASEMIEAPDQDHEPNQRELEINETDELVLKSSHPLKVVGPLFQLSRGNELSSNDQSSSNVRIRLKSIALHDATIYPASTESSDTQNTIWPEIGDNGFQVVALEGLGWIEGKQRKGGFRKSFEKSTTVGFCYPINVATTVSVPSKCVFDVSNLPFYTPGLMTTGVLLWNLADSCKQSSNIYVVVDDESRVHCQLFANMLSKYKKSHVHTESKEKISDVKTEARASAQTVVILTKIKQAHLDLLQQSCRNIQRIVSIDQYFSRPMQRWVVHNLKGTHMHILNTERMFTQSELSEKIPKVHSWLKSLDNTVRLELKQYTDSVENEDNETDPFILPYPTISVHESQSNYEHIPLKVFRTEVFRKNGCYILVGGLTGLGWELLQVMAELGAGYLVTFSRRPPSPEKQADIDRIQSDFKCKILSVQVDITDLKHLKKTMQELQSQIGEAQVKGLFHGGGVVFDMLLSNMTEEDAEKPLQPKVLGTWNLHLVTKDMPLDFFVMHSSIVSILGNPGQCNYAAGNSFQDSFAHYRRSLGLCGQSINWSTLSLGMATENKELEKNFRSQGFFYLSLEDVRSCFIRAVMTNPPQVTFGIFDWSRLEFHPTVKMYPYKFVKLLDKYGTKNKGFQKMDSKYHFDIEEFSKLDAEGQREMVVDLLKTMVTDTFVVEKDSLDEESRFVTLGIDSMAAMSFTNSIFETTQVRIPVVTLLSDATTIGSLTAYILENIFNGSSDNNSKGENESKKLLEFLEGSVTFMQKSLLKDFVKNPHSRNFMRQADYEVKGLNLKPKDWKVMLNHLLKMNPELRRIYTINKEESKFESQLLSPDVVDVDMELVPFDSICDENATDDRETTFFDLTKDQPIRFKIACKKDKTRMRMYIHSVISDLSGVAMLFRDIGSYMKPYICNEPLPEKETNIVPAECVRTALSPRMADMKQYWKLQLSQDIQPFTFSDDIERELDESNWYQVKQDLPQELVDSVLQHVQKGGNSLYNFVISVYMAFLNYKTGKDLIPIVTNVDMRGHVPQVKSFVTRCINAIPVIGDLRNMGTVGEYVKKSSDRMHHMTQQSGFPYELIEEEMQSDTLRKHIGRHRIVMDNMANLNQTFKHNRVTVKLMNVFHTRYVYETTLYVLYDLTQNKVALEYGYNADAVSHEYASEVPLKLMELMKAFIECDTATVSDVLDGNVVVPNLTLPPVNVGNGHTKTSQQNGKENGSSPATEKTPLKENGYTKRLSFDYLNRKRMSLQSSIIDRASRDGNFVVLREDYFKKQTTQGWDHDVQVAMAKDTSDENNGELLLQWGKAKESRRKSVSLEGVSEVHVKRINGAYGLLMKISKRWIVLKTRSQAQAADWLNTFRSELQAKRKSSRTDNPVRL